MPARRDSRAPSGRFVLRIDSRLHALLRRDAQDGRTSLNDHCARKLAAHPGVLAVGSWPQDVVAKVTHLHGRDLIAAAVYGSWARGEAADGSDIDLLVVLDPRVKLTRRLYDAWDDAPMNAEGRSIEPHLVHLPPPEKTVAGIWAEVALDGIVLFDPDLRLSRRLALVRRDVISGRIVRRTAHGHPYWVTTEVA